MNSFFYNSPIGHFQIMLSENEIVAALFVDENEVKEDSCTNEQGKIVQEITRMLDAYFLHKKPFSQKELSQLFRIEALNGTLFQRKVWSVISSIRFGEVMDYTTLATLADNPSAVRAAASACGKNPLALFIPCHRVVRKTNEDYGYSWGPERKKYLLTHEGIHLHT